MHKLCQKLFDSVFIFMVLQLFDTVDWATWRASGL